MANKEITIAASIKNCALMAMEVLINAKMVNANKVRLPVLRSPLIEVSKPKYALKLSLKPTKYSAMLNAVPVKSVMPIAPPMGSPRLREST